MLHARGGEVGVDPASRRLQHAAVVHGPEALFGAADARRGEGRKRGRHGSRRVRRAAAAQRADAGCMEGQRKQCDADEGRPRHGHGRKLTWRDLEARPPGR